MFADLIYFLIILILQLLLLIFIKKYKQKSLLLLLISLGISLSGALSFWNTAVLIDQLGTNFNMISTLLFILSLFTSLLNIYILAKRKLYQS